MGHSIPSFKSACGRNTWLLSWYNVRSHYVCNSTMSSYQSELNHYHHHHHLSSSSSSHHHRHRRHHHHLYYTSSLRSSKSFAKLFGCPSRLRRGFSALQLSGFCKADIPRIRSLVPKTSTDPQVIQLPKATLTAVNRRGLGLLPRAAHPRCLLVRTEPSACADRILASIMA